jgi:hypothetical protein
MLDLVRVYDYNKFLRFYMIINLNYVLLKNYWLYVISVKFGA